MLGARLKAHYESTGVSQQELANRFNTKQSWISRIYNGEFTQRSSIARALCENANIPFISELQDANSTDAKIYKIAAELTLMKSDDVRAVRKLFGILKQVG